MVDSTTTAPVDDVVDPVISILSPANLDTVAGITAITVNSTDNIAIESITFMIGSTQIGQATTQTFVNWDTRLFADGATPITVIATDTSGNSASANINVTVDNQVAPVIDSTPPIVTITNPADSQRVAGTVTIAADAVDDVAVDSVTFSVGQTEIAVISVPPYEVVWDTTVFAEGSQQISVVAVDTNANSSEAVMTVSVDNIVTCTVYSCSSPPPPSTEPPPVQTMPSNSSPDGEFETELASKDTMASTITLESGAVLKITASTEFMGSIVSNIDELLVGHVIQGEFFRSTREIVWIEADLPPGL
jgi:hypothetical protein